jgi:RNA polymerase sigma-70 factor (ECF subfamily)
LLLRDVFGWHAAEVATLLDTSVGSVKSALQRARSTLAGRHLTSDDAPAVAHDDRRALVSRYVDAFERADVASMVKLLRDDAVLSMPPHLLWLQGPHDIGRFLERKRASLVGSRLVPVAANGGPAFAYYKASADGTRSAFAIIVLELSPGRIRRIDTFIDADLFPLFNLPLRIDGSERLATDEQRIGQPDEVEQGS